MNATDAEQIVIGQILLDYRVMSQAAQLLKADHFGDAKCKAAYECCLTVWRLGRGVDLITVAEQLRKDQRIDVSATMKELVGYTRRVSAPKHFDDHAQIVKEHYATRLLAKAGQDLISGTSSGEEYIDLIGPANEALTKATLSQDRLDVNAGERAYQLLNSADRPKPMYMGITGLDSFVWMLPGNVIAIRADAGVGKTAFVLSVVLNMMPRIKPWFVSLEMPADELIKRTLCQLALVDIASVMVDRISDDERARLAKAANEHASILSTLQIDDSGSMTIDEFQAKAESRVKDGTGLIVVDYAQLMSADRKLYPNKVSELEAISMGIRSTARKLNVPILLIVHVNKQGEDHGTIQFEKDAHVRMHLRRDGQSNNMDIDVLKNRNGRPGKITTTCLMQYGIVGRTTPPHWAEQPKVTPKDVPHPDEFHDDNPF
jgi:replicative DNA helicase